MSKNLLPCALLLLSACGAPLANIPRDEVSVTFAPKESHYGLQAIVKALTPDLLHHVRLRLARKGSDGTFLTVAGAEQRLVPSEFGNPIVLHHLRLDSTYRITIDAFTGADESQPPVSVPAESTTDIQTPAATTANGQATAENVLATGPLRLKLQDTLYTGRKHVQFTNSMVALVPLLTVRVKVTLQRQDGGSWATVGSFSDTPAHVQAGFDLKALRYGSAYRLGFNGYTVLNLPTWPENSYYYAFTTPSPTDGQLDTDMGAESVTLPAFSLL